MVVAAGTGSRFGAPKQFADLAGRPVASWSLATARQVGAKVVLVVPAADLHCCGWDADVVVAGGSTRSASVRAGLAATAPDAEIIVVHDAARPLASVRLWWSVLDAVGAGADGAIPVIPVADTVRQLTPGGARILDRSGLVAVQTPQAFRAATLRRAHATAGDATDDAALVEAVGGRVVHVDGTPANIKVTSPSDLVVAAALLAAGQR